MLIRVTPLALAASLCLAACGGTSTDPVANACDDYCALAMRNCKGAVAQYSDISTCMATGSGRGRGTAGDTSGNTIACRTYWAAISEGDELMCTRAGPGGDGTCGTNCQSFCATTMAICGDQPSPPYASVAACETACQGFDMNERFDASDLGGNTLACRIYHMTAASTEPDTHCRHTKQQSDVCL